MHQIETGFMIAALVLLAVLGRAVFIYCSPYRACRVCRKGGLLAGSLPGRMLGLPALPRRRRRCWRCKGSKLTRRIGAKTVHKVKLSVQQAWAERGTSTAGTPGGDS